MKAKCKCGLKKRRRKTKRKEGKRRRKWRGKFCRKRGNRGRASTRKRLKASWKAQRQVALIIFSGDSACACCEEETFLTLCIPLIFLLLFLLPFFFFDIIAQRHRSVSALKRQGTKGFVCRVKRYKCTVFMLISQMFFILMEMELEIYISGRTVVRYAWEIRAACESKRFS